MFYSISDIMRKGIIEGLKISINSVIPGKSDKVFEEQIGKGKFLWDAVDLVKLPALLWGLGGIAVGIFITIITTLNAPYLILPILSQVILNVVLVSLLFIVKFVIEQYILKYLSGFFGGRGDINNQAYLLGFVTAGILLVNTVIGVTVIGLILYPITFLWYLYLMYKVLRRVHSLSSLNAIFVIILDAVFWLIATAIFAGIMTLIGFGMSAMVSGLF